MITTINDLKAEIKTIQEIFNTCPKNLSKEDYLRLVDYLISILEYIQNKELTNITTDNICTNLKECNG